MGLCSFATPEIAAVRPFPKLDRFRERRSLLACRTFERKAEPQRRRCTCENQIPALAYLLIHLPCSDGSLDKRDRTIAACHIAGF